MIRKTVRESLIALPRYLIDPEWSYEEKQQAHASLNYRECELNDWRFSIEGMAYAKVETGDWINPPDMVITKIHFEFTEIEYLNPETGDPVRLTKEEREIAANHLRGLIRLS